MDRERVTLGLGGGERAGGPALVDSRLERRELAAHAADHVVRELRRDDLALDQEHARSAGEAGVVRQCEGRRDPGFDLLGRRTRRGDLPPEPLAGERSLTVEQCEEQLGLAAEVAVEGPGREPGLVEHVVDPQPCVAAPRQHRFRRREQQLHLVDGPPSNRRDGAATRTVHRRSPRH